MFTTTSRIGHEDQRAGGRRATAGGYRPIPEYGRVSRAPLMMGHQGHQHSIRVPSRAVRLGAPGMILPSLIELKQGRERSGSTPRTLSQRIKSCSEWRRRDQAACRPSRAVVLPGSQPVADRWENQAKFGSSENDTGSRPSWDIAPLADARDRRSTSSHPCADRGRVRLRLVWVTKH